jgi:F0F1-type ATP synthase membrane subunit c/vacuolar-type H+-ATPase subunit K
MDLATIERLGAIIGGIIVGFVAFYALYQDWKTPGIENHVFKLMLLLLGVGAVVALLAGVGVFPDEPLRAPTAAEAAYDPATIDNLIARSALNFRDHRELLGDIPPKPRERTLQLYQW